MRMFGTNRFETINHQFMITILMLVFRRFWVEIYLPILNYSIAILRQSQKSLLKRILRLVHQLESIRNIPLRISYGQEDRVKVDFFRINPTFDGEGQEFRSDF